VGVLEWYRQRFIANGLDKDGKIVIFPSQALETWQCPGYPPTKENCVTNDGPTVAGLMSVLERVLALPTSALQPVVPTATLMLWKEFKTQVPPLPGLSAGQLSPCEACPKGTANVENPELYAVHPYRIFTKAKNFSAEAGGSASAYSSLDPAIKAFDAEKFKGDAGWNQNAMDAALLGLTGRAQAFVLARALTPPAKGYRFPAFMPHEQDYPPSSDHLGVFNAALTYMLLQPVDDAAQTVLLLPSWPCGWDVSFKLHAPLATTITGHLVNGTLQFDVTPAARKADVKVAPCSK
jgi:hypothetical protein